MSPKILSAPNILSALRLAAAPLLAAAFWIPQWGGAPAAGDIAAFAVFAMAAATDFADGWLARKSGKQTQLGAFLDPVADKILVATALLLLLDAGRAAAGACLLIVGREILVSALREWSALSGRAAATKVSAMGKWKTGLQIAAVLFLFAADIADPMIAAWLGYENDSLQLVKNVGDVLLWSAAALALWSMADYGRAAWRAMTEK